METMLSLLTPEELKLNFVFLNLRSIESSHFKIGGKNIIVYVYGDSPYMLIGGLSDAQMGMITEDLFSLVPPLVINRKCRCVN